MTKRHYKTNIVASLIAFVISLCSLTVAAQSQHTDSLTTRKESVVNSEVRGRMMTSPLPVNIRQQGRQICVQSRYNQLLPVYTESGTFYTAFRLCKGTNWLTGLPKGTYLINNRKYTIY